MVCYNIFWKKSAIKELKKIDVQWRKRIISDVEKLATNPCPPSCKKLVGVQNIYRIRISDYRVIYQVYAETITIEIARVRHRREVYEHLDTL